MFPSLTPDPRLLAIEDDPTLGAHLFQHLNGSGFEVTWCRDGEEGLAAARSGGYDLILMDIMLPGAMASRFFANSARSRRCR